MLGYEGKATINEVDQIRQRKGSWPVWIDLQKEGIKGNFADDNSHSLLQISYFIFAQKLALETKAASKNATSLNSGPTLESVIIQKTLFSPAR